MFAAKREQLGEHLVVDRPARLVKAVWTATRASRSFANWTIGNTSG